jgi:hypothetical protein
MERSAGLNRSRISRCVKVRLFDGSFRETVVSYNPFDAFCHPTDILCRKCIESAIIFQNNSGRFMDAPPVGCEKSKEKIEGMILLQTEMVRLHYHLPKDPEGRLK